MGAPSWRVGTGSFHVRPAAEQGVTEMGTTQVVQSPPMQSALGGLMQKERSYSPDLEERLSSAGVPNLFNTLSRESYALWTFL